MNRPPSFFVEDMVFLLGVALCSALWSANAHAHDYTPGTVGTSFCASNVNESGSCISSEQPTKAGACSAWVSETIAGGSGAHLADYGGWGHERCYYTNCTACGGPGTYGGVGFSTKATGPESCEAGHTLVEGECVHDAECEASGTPFSTGLFLGTAESPQRIGCESGCGVSFSGSMAGRVLVNGVYAYYWQGTYAYMGPSETCTEGPPTPGVLEDIPAPTCGEGQTLGTINGRPQCFDTGTGDPVNPNSGSTQSGPTTNTQADTPEAGQTTTTTTNPDGSVQTVVKDSAGNVLSDTTVGGDPLKAFCEENPRADVCSESTFGGSCGSGFVCEGDAARCALAREVHTRNCQWYDETTAQSTLGQAAMAGTDSGTTDNPSLVANREEVSMSALLSQDRWLSSSTLTDQSFELPAFLGAAPSITVPWSLLNDPLLWLGNLLVAFCLLGAIRYVFS